MTQGNDCSGTIVLVEPNRLWRDGLGRILTDCGYSVLASVDDLASALGYKDRNRDSASDGDGSGGGPDLLIVDAAALPDDPAARLAEVRQSLPATRIAVFIGADDAVKSLRCFQAGADGCLSKDISADAMAMCLRLVQLGERLFPSNLIAALLEERPLQNGVSSFQRIGDDDLVAPSQSGLSAREKEILACLAIGKSNKEIAQRVNLTEATVKVHLRNILRKIQAKNRTQAAIWAIKHGIADPYLIA